MSTKVNIRTAFRARLRALRGPRSRLPRRSSGRGRVRAKGLPARRISCARRASAGAVSARSKVVHATACIAAAKGQSGSAVHREGGGHTRGTFGVADAVELGTVAERGEAAGHRLGVERRGHSRRGQVELCLCATQSRARSVSASPLRPLFTLLALLLASVVFAQATDVVSCADEKEGTRTEQATGSGDHSSAPHDDGPLSADFDCLCHAVYASTVVAAAVRPRAPLFGHRFADLVAGVRSRTVSPPTPIPLG